MKISRRCFVFILLMAGVFPLVLTACNSTTPEPPTATPEPTATPAPTSTPLPTPTLTPTPDPAAFIEEAESRFWQSDLEGAVALYQKALEVQPDYVPAYVGLSWMESWRSAENSEAVLEYAQKAVEVAPDDAMAQATLARAYLMRDEAAKALEAAEKAVALDPQSAYVQSALTQAYLLDSRYDEAQKAAETAYTLDPESLDARYALAGFYRETSDFARARVIYEQTVALKPEFFGTYKLLGRFWLLRERYDEAEAALNKALELLPQDFDSMLSLAEVYIARHDYESAKSWLEKAEASATEAEKAAIYVERGYLYYQKQEYDEALTHLNQALKLRPDDYNVRLQIGFVYLGKEECSRAEREFQSLTEAQPRFIGAHVGIGFAKLCDGDAAKALTYFRKAIQIDPYSVSAYRGMGIAYAEQERWEDSDAAYIEAMRLSPAPATLHVDLGQSYLQQEKTDEAKAEYQLAVKLNPYSQDALIGLARIMLNQQQEEQALRVIQEAAALDDSKKDVQYLLGILTVLRGDPQAGAAILENVLVEDPENAYAHYFLGVAYCEMGRYRDAKKSLETYQALADTQQDYQLQNFMTALDKGFKLADDKAIKEMQELFDQFMDDKPEIVIAETGDATRMMTITIALSADDLKTDNTTQLYRKIGIVAAIAALRAPQIDPPVAGGVLMQYVRSGKPQFTVHAALNDLKRFFYGWTGGQQFATALEYSRILTSGTRTSLRDVERQIAEVRELDFKATVPSETITKDELRDRLVEGIDHQEHEALENDEAMLELLGLIDPALDLEEMLVDVQTEQTAGFYTPEDDRFYVLETEEQTSADQTVIAHEYVHALQDQHFDLAQLDDETADDDRHLAFRALVEGDATLSTILYASDYVMAIDMLELMSSVGGVEDEVLETTPMFIRESLAFPYSAGLKFVQALYDRGGWEEVNAAYETPPQSTEQILHPERYWDKDAPVSVTLGDLTSKLGGTWQELDNDVMGELGLRLILATHAGPALAIKAAEGWGGDRYVFLQTDGAYVTVLNTSWDSDKEAAEFLKLYRAMMEHRPDFTLEVPALVGEMHDYRWLAQDNCVYVTQKEKQVTILVGTTCAAVEQVQAVVP